MLKTVAIIVAAGQGSRLIADLPKQYLPLGNKSILATTLDVFLGHEQIHDVICVINPDFKDTFLTSIGDRRNNVTWTHGGSTRQDSVRLGLEKAQDLNPDLTLIHDAARPFVDAQTITKILEKLEDAPACLPLISVADSLKRDDGSHLVNIDRQNLYGAQTPQGFLFTKIYDAHQKANGKQSFTDDIAVAEWAGIEISQVTGTKKNFKITTSEDYQMACQINAAKGQIRVGHGYDVHAFEEGKQITLCGVDIPFDKKLKGHSDADVGLHALTDAIYGAIGDGDIGHHFPPSDDKWKGATSDIFLEHAMDHVRNKDGYVSNLDVTLVCEAPKIGPHREKMREKIAKITKLDISQISVKATTSEGLGFTGRSEGISAFATATVNL